MKKSVFLGAGLLALALSSHSAELFVNIHSGGTMAQGAGIETAERMSAAGVTVVLSGYVGPKAFEALKAAGIKVCQDLDGMTVR